MPILTKRANKTPLGIYVHVPFCRSKCQYCDFYSLTTKDDKLMDGYLDAICAHIKETGLKANGFEPIVIMQSTNSGRYSKPTGVPDPMIGYNCPPLEDTPLDSSRILTDDQLDQVAGGANEGDIQVFYCARDCKCSREFKCDANGKWVCMTCGKYRGSINVFAR